MTYRQAFIISCFQCLALWSGFSRAGSTFASGILLGVDRYAASVFYFILAVLITIGASGLDLYKNLHFVTMFAVDFVTAFVVVLITLKTFLSLIKRISFVPFSYRRRRRLHGLHISCDANENPHCGNTVDLR